MKSLWRSRERADEAADKLHKFSHPMRLMILSLLLEGEKSVTEIDVATRIGQPALSQQLAELRRADLVMTRRQAKQIFYSLVDESVEHYVRNIETVFGGKPFREAKQAGKTAPEPRLQSGDTAGAANFARMR